MPSGALLKRQSKESILSDYIDKGLFGSFQDPERMDFEYVVSGADKISGAVEWFTQTVATPVEDWFEGRNSLDKLIELARTPTSSGTGNINPRLFRGTVALCLVNNRFRDAALLMDWYIERGKFNFLDSMERARCFAAALESRFPEYAEAWRRS